MQDPQLRKRKFKCTGLTGGALQMRPSDVFRLESEAPESTNQSTNPVSCIQDTFRIVIVIVARYQ